MYQKLKVDESLAESSFQMTEAVSAWIYQILRNAFAESPTATRFEETDFFDKWEELIRDWVENYESYKPKSTGRRVLLNKLELISKKNK